MNFKKFKYGFIENIIAYIIIFLVFFYLSPLKEDFLHMNIHPLLIVVSLSALRYGNYIGLMSAIMAGITYILAYILLGKDIYLIIVDFDYYKFILMFFLSAVIFGRFKDNYETNLKKQKSEYKILENKHKDLIDEYNKLKFIKDELKKQIIGAEYSIISLYEIASSLESLDSEDIYTEVIYIFEKFLKVKSMAIYTIDNKQRFLRLKLNKGKDIKLQNSIPIKESICFNELINKKEPIKNNFRCDKKDSNCPIMLAPIIKNDKIIAVVSIYNMEFEMITDYSYNLFKVIIEWINKALVQAIEVEEKENKYYTNTRIMKYEFFKKRLEEEKERNQRYEMDYSLIKILNKESTLSEIQQILEDTVRGADVVSYNEINKILYLLLPATEKSNSHKVVERILNNSQNKLELIEN